MKSNTIRAGIGAVSGAAIGLLIGGSNLQLVWAIVGAVLGAVVGAIVGIVLGNRITAAREKAEAAGLTGKSWYDSFGGSGGAF